MEKHLKDIKLMLLGIALMVLLGFSAYFELISWAIYILGMIGGVALVLRGFVREYIQDMPAYGADAQESKATEEIQEEKVSEDTKTHNP